jgi:hypothetical protein
MAAQLPARTHRIKLAVNRVHAEICLGAIFRTLSLYIMRAAAAIASTFSSILLDLEGHDELTSHLAEC